MVNGDKVNQYADGAVFLDSSGAACPDESRQETVYSRTSPIMCRYIDWPFTVPLQMVEFYLLPPAVQPNTTLIKFGAS